MVDGLVRLMHSGSDVSLVNLGSDVVYKMADVAKMIIEMVKSNSKIVYKDGLLFYTKKGTPDLRRAKEQLDWVPLVRLQEGLRKTIDYAIASKEMVGLGRIWSS
jgi:UDP-glucuronate decarboxylase